MPGKWHNKMEAKFPDEGSQIFLFIKNSEEYLAEIILGTQLCHLTITVAV